MSVPDVGDLIFLPPSAPPSGPESPPEAFQTPEPADQSPPEARRIISFGGIGDCRHVPPGDQALFHVDVEALNEQMEREPAEANEHPREAFEAPAVSQENAPPLQTHPLDDYEGRWGDDDDDSGGWLGDDDDNWGSRDDDPLSPESIECARLYAEEARLDQIRMDYEEQVRQEKHRADAANDRAQFWEEQCIQVDSALQLSRRVLATQQAVNVDAMEAVKVLNAGLKQARVAAQEVMHEAAKVEASRPELLEIVTAYPWLKRAYYEGAGLPPGRRLPDEE